MPTRTRHPALVPRDAVLPPAPPGVRYVRVPLLGIVVADDRRRRGVDRFFHWPMIVLALAILPLLLVEFVKQPEGTLRVLVDVGFAVIWLAFFVEFLIKIAIAESRFEYMRRNWLDVIIIIVPVLRPLRASSVMRSARVFKLRGVGMKLARYVFTMVIGLEATERFLERVGLRARADRKDPRRMTRHELMREVARLRRLADRWDAWYEHHERHVDEHGGACFLDPRPVEPAEADDPAPPSLDRGRAEPAGP